MLENALSFSEDDLEAEKCTKNDHKFKKNTIYLYQDIVINLIKKFTYIKVSQFTS